MRSSNIVHHRYLKLFSIENSNKILEVINIFKLRLIYIKSQNHL